LVDYDKYNRYIGQSMATKAIVIQGGRGCPYHCAYCHKIWPKTYVVRSAEHIFSEVKLNYDMGMRQFAFVDDIFNLNRENSMKFFQMVIDSGLNKDIQFYFPNGLRGDILTHDYIDLMVAAGTVSCALALETASPRLQKLLHKNLNLDKFRDNINYICEKYPQVILELFTMHGFPSETEEEALMTLDFIKSIKWIHFPYINMLKIYPNTDMEKLALAHGVTRESILRSENYAHTQVSDNCTLEKSFTLKYRSDFLYDYFLLKERLLQVLPHQVKILTTEEILQKYNSYLSTEFTQLDDLFNHLGIGSEESIRDLKPKMADYAGGFHAQWVERSRRTAGEPAPDALRVLLLDMSQLFTGESDFAYDVMGEAPLGMLYLLTYLNHCFGAKVKGKIAKSRMDFDNFTQLKTLLDEFQPHVIGLRTLSIYKDFFHHTIAMIRQWGFAVPIIVGGPYPTSDPNTVLRDRNIDLAVLGEGEITFAEVIASIMAENGKLPAREKLEQIQGIAFMPQNTGCRETLLTDVLAQTLNRLPGENPSHVNSPTDLAYSIFTSGSTGRPKGVLIEHRHVHHLVVSLKQRIYNSHRLSAGLKVGLVSPFVFDASVKQIFAALLQGHCLCIIPEQVRTDVEQLFEFYRENCIDIADGTPAHIGMLTEAMSERRSSPGVRRFLIGGEALTRQVVEGFFACIPAGAPAPVFTNIYGPSECTVDTTAFDITMDNIDSIANIPIGKPMPNSRVYILDIYGSVVPLGVTGELCIAGAGVGRGYLNDPQLTAEKFNRSYRTHKTYILYQTGDLARWLPDGNIAFAGRCDQQVKIRGFRIELADIEKQLQRYKHIKDAVVIARQDQKEDKYLCAYITWNTEPKESDIPELREYLAGELPEYMIPGRFVRLEKLPLTPNGKIDRRGLPAPESEAGATYSPPRDILEEKLVETWSDLLGKQKDKLGIDDNFFEIGGHSLKVTILIARMHKAFNVKIPLTEIFRGPTIRELAARIRKSGAQEDFSAIPPVEKKEYYPLTSAMTRLYFEQQLDPESTAYNISSVAVLEGKLDKNRFDGAFKELLRRHESLRTSFRLLEGQPIQKVHESETVAFDVAYGQLNNAPASLTETIVPFLKPFDLSRPPLMRVGLFKTGETGHVFVVNINHIIADGTSITILGREFMALYNNEPLPPLKLQYKDFSEWKYRQVLQEPEAMEKQERFWLEQFSGEIPVLTLPYDYPRPARKSSAGDVIETVVGEEETRRLRALATRENATLYMLGLSLFNVLLMKLSGQEDIVIGSPNAGRFHVDLEPLIGMFVNTLPLRNQPRGNLTFQAFLKEVKERTLAAFANQDYSFETLVSRVMARRDPSRSPLADVFFAVQNMERPALKSSELRMRPYEHGHFNARFDMCFHVFEEGQELHFMMEYCTHLFKRETVEMFIKNFNEVAAAALENPAILLRDITISTEIKNVEAAAPQVDLGF
ncbi:MAG TPA: condensation domain-containing protein, partial [Candidatus Deferrimicrobium sp.]|nr:condensation domain-containing protein [Candidatus Deferrimicrobium sp.]